ncbi:hypothetical protein [Singulisphaera acidiphila]|uniref:Uncharacterized protein n=1 Tax=Singulisphaera acidiphila (strain ATCC BAA-1392 / DSM 18658 / VKM B-2454 / MOB10) TaxID=886293 RepID=L0D9J9_SINAD|nr:hypothetical protein [Singulisphaera acidiphila]AGA26069.1 hypothetical protein Sinac_1693 [Singulisphaera acidiphila DSM 18658]
MDRAWIVRLTFRRLILLAVVIQATTPDLLDLSWLSQSLPPGASAAASGPSPSDKGSHPTGQAPARLPVIDPAAKARLGVSARNSRPISKKRFSLESAALPAEFEVGNESPERLCEPIWPELGLKLERNGNASARLKPGGSLPTAQIAVWQVRIGVQHALDSAKTVLRPRILHRLLC